MRMTACTLVFCSRGLSSPSISHFPTMLPRSSRNFRRSLMRLIDLDNSPRDVPLSADARTEFAAIPAICAGAQRACGYHHSA